MIYDVEEDEYVHDDEGDWRDDDWTEPDPPDDYYDRTEPEPMGSYDDQFTQHERARVEALRILGGQGASTPDMVREMPVLAELILGPEASAPNPYPQLREACAMAGALVAKAGDESDPWTDQAKDDAVEVTVTRGELRTLRNLLESVTHPF